MTTLGFSIHSTMSSSNNHSFTFSFPIWMPFISCLIALARTSNTILNRQCHEWATLFMNAPSFGEAEACAGHEVRLSLCSMSVATLSGAGSSPQVLEQKPWSHAWVSSALFECMFCPKGGQCWSKRESCTHWGSMCRLSRYSLLCFEAQAVSHPLLWLSQV